MRGRNVTPGKRLTLRSRLYPVSLKHISSPPKALYVVSDNLEELLQRPKIAIVGSRNPTVYGKQATWQLAAQLAEQGIVIVSGLALGVDGIAHQAALTAHGLTIAVLPGSLDTIVPASHTPLAAKIVENGGALMSEYDSSTPTYKQNFIARNRIVAGIADAVLITEASSRSGSLHTAQFALKQARPVLAVPGNITSPNSAGANTLLKQGAGVVTSYEDVLKMLGIPLHQTPAHLAKGDNEREQHILDLLLQGKGDGDELLFLSQLGTAEFNQTLTMLELAGKIKSLGSNQWALT